MCTEPFELLPRVAGADRDDRCPRRETGFDSSWCILDYDAVLGVLREQGSPLQIGLRVWLAVRAVVSCEDMAWGCDASCR